MGHPPTRPEEGLFGEADSSYPDALPVMPEVGGGGLSNLIMVYHKLRQKQTMVTGFPEPLAATGS